MSIAMENGVMEADVNELRLDLEEYLLKNNGVETINFSFVSDVPGECYNAARAYADNLREQYRPLGEAGPSVVAEGMRVIITLEEDT